MNLDAAECDKVTDCDARRVSYDLKFVVLAVTLAVLWGMMFNITTLASKFLLAIYALSYLFGCWKTRRAVLFVLPVMYLPYVWVFPYLESPASPDFWYWISFAWQWPGMLAAVMIHPQGQPYFDFVTTGVTTAMFFGAVLLARPSVSHAGRISFIVLALSIANSFLCYVHLT